MKPVVFRIIAAALSAAAVAVAGETGPRLVCDDPLYDFGEAAESEVVEHAFVLRNSGDRTAVIDNVRTTCGCTVALPDDSMLPPGRSTEIKARLSLRGRHGRQRIRIMVELDDDRHPPLELVMTGNVDSPVRAFPGYVLFGRVETDEQAERTLRVEGRDGSPEVIKLECRPAQLEARGTAGGNYYQVTVRTVPPLEPGELRGMITVVVAGGDELTVPVRASVAGAVTVTPAELLLSRHSSEATRRSLVVQSRGDEPLRVLDVEAPDPSIRVRVREVDAERTHVFLDNIRPEESLDGSRVMLRTNRDEMPEVSVPIRLIPSLDDNAR